MFTVEFSTTIGEDGTIVMPADYVAHLPKGEPVRVVVYTETREMPEATSLAEEDLPSLEELVAEIKALPRNPATIRQASGLLGEHLAHPLTQPDLNFDLKAWENTWDRLEAEMKAAELAEEEEELKYFIQ